MNRKFWENIIHQNTFFQFQTNLSTNNSLVGLRFTNFRLFQSRNYIWTFFVNPKMWEKLSEEVFFLTNILKFNSGTIYKVVNKNLIWEI